MNNHINQINTETLHKFKLFKCIRFKSEISSKSSGERPIQKFSGCGVMIRLCLKNTKLINNKYVLTKLSIKHNHQITFESYKAHPSNRKMNTDIQIKASQMVAVNGKPAKIARMLSQETNTVLIAKDIQNIQNKLKMVIEDGYVNNFYFVQNDDKTEFYYKICGNKKHTNWEPEGHKLTLLVVL